MKLKPVIPRLLANQDVESAVDYYAAEVSEKVALGFVSNLEQVYGQISRYPATGASRYAHELNLPGVRFWALKRYPYVIFYFEKTDHIDVWRVLHSLRDIPEWLRDEEEHKH